MSEQWRSVWQVEVPGALHACRSALKHVKDATEALEPRTGDSEGAFNFNLLLSAEESIEMASHYLSEAMAQMGGAELLTLLRDGKHAEGLALARLEAAREHGQDALRWLHGCRSRLWTVGYLLGGLPGAPPHPVPLSRRSLEDMIRAAADQLNPVYGSTMNMSALASFAAEPVARTQMSPTNC